MTEELKATLGRLDDQIAWYDKKSGENQRAFKGASFAEILLAVSIPITAWLSPNYVPAITGAFVALLRALSTLNQWEYNWTNYRSTAEKLKHEKYLFQGRAGPYADVENIQRLLAERIEATISREHAAWVTISQRRRQDEKPTSD